MKLVIEILFAVLMIASGFLLATEVGQTTSSHGGLTLLSILLFIVVGVFKYVKYDQYD